MRHATHASIPLLAALLVGCPNDGPEPGADTGAPRDSGADARADAGPDATADAAPDAAPDADPITVTAGAWAVTVDFARRSFTWGAPGQEPLVRLPADAIQLGEVPGIEDDLSYDPYPFLVESLGRPPRLSGWRTLTALAPSEEAGAPGEVVLRATFEGGHGATITLSSGDEGRATLRLLPDADALPFIAYMRVRARVDEQEAFYGLGEYFDHVNHRGQNRAMHIIPKQGVESGYNEAHVPIPFVTGTRGWGMFIENPAPAVFGVASEEDDLVDAIFGTGPNTRNGLDVHLFAADHPLDVTRHFYAVTGQPRLPARWAYGPLVWRDENDDQAQLESDLNIMRDLDLPASGVWIDRPYATAVNTFDFLPSQFPDPEGMVDLTHRLGFRIGLWHTPYLDVGSQATSELRRVANESGYYPPTPGTRLNPWGGAIDLTNPDARAWWQSNLSTYTDLGFEGYKLDYMEDIVPGLLGARTKWEFFDGTTERVQHQYFQFTYHQTYFQTLDPEAPFLLCRSATWGSQTLGVIIWPGDLDASLTYHREIFTNRRGEEIDGVGGLPAALIAGLGLGPSGFPFYGSDTGGYRHSPTTKEIFTRWFQQTALSTVMQIGTSANDVAWEFEAENGFDEEMLGWYRVYTRLHLRLFPYVWSYAATLATDGRAIQRPLGLAYPELGVHPDDTYLMGDHLLVAPVVREGVTERPVTLPPGDWIDWWTGEVIAGGREVTAAAPLSTLPLYLQAGGLVPMLRPTIDTLSPTEEPARVDSYATDPGVVHLRAGAHSGDGSTSFTLFDGAGATYARAGQTDTFTLTGGAEFTSGWEVELVGRGGEPERVTSGATELAKATSLEALREGALDGWWYDAAATRPTLHVRVGQADATLEASYSP
jgi:alpha-D-xyloside xylohydrolase